MIRRSQPLCGNLTMLRAYGKAGNGNEMETVNCKLETGNWKQKWKHNLFAAVVLARFNCCYPSALPASSFCFASLASLASFPDLPRPSRCPSCSAMCDCLVFLTWVWKSLFMFSAVFYFWCSIHSNQLILYKYALYMRWCLNQNTNISALASIGWGQWLGMGLLYIPRAWVWSHNLLRTMKVGLGTRLQE